MQTVKVAPWKVEAVQKLTGDLAKTPVIAVADLSKVRSIQIQEIRRKLRGKVRVTVVKNTLFRKSAEAAEAKRRGLSKFAEQLTGSSLYMLTDMDPFDLVVLLEKSKVKVPAKVGDIATSDILIAAGNTGLPPGPVISEFGEVDVATRIEGGSIWVVRDTLVAEKGEVISQKLASLLSRLGMKPIEAGLSLKAAYDHGSILTAEHLRLDLEATRKSLTDGIHHAMAVALEAGYFTKQTAPLLIAKAYRQALTVAVEAGYPVKEAMQRIVQKAQRAATTLSEMIRAKNPEAGPKEQA